MERHITASGLTGAVALSAAVALWLPAGLAAQTVSAKPGTSTPGGQATDSGTQQPSAHVTGYVIVDLTADRKDPDATQIVSFGSATVSSSTTAIKCVEVVAPDPKAEEPLYAIGHLSALVTCAASAAVPLQNRVAAAEHIRLLAKAASDESTPRFISTKGEGVRVVIIDRAEAFFVKKATVPFMVRGRRPSVTFKEEARETQFVTDMRSLLQVAAGIGAESGPRDIAPANVETKPVTWAFVSNHTLRLKRATVTVSAEAGRAASILVKPDTITDDEAVRLIEEFEALRAPSVRCENGQPAEPRSRSIPFFVLACRAESSTTVDEQVSAIEGLGTMGDARAIPALVRLSGSGSDVRIRTAALTALSRLKTSSGAPAAAAAKTEEQPGKPTAQLVTGPVEHWFLSADVPLNDVKALTFDEDTDQVSLGDEPSTFYIGINFLLGDLKNPARSLLGNVVLKGMIKASNRPLDSFGAAIGLRGQYLSKWGLNLDALTPFIAVTATQEDIEENGVVIRRARRNSEFRFGVALNLDQAVKWVGGK